MSDRAGGLDVGVTSGNFVDSNETRILDAVVLLGRGLSALPSSLSSELHSTVCIEERRYDHMEKEGVLTECLVEFGRRIGPRSHRSRRADAVAN